MSKLKIGLSGLAGIGALYALFGKDKPRAGKMSKLDSSMIQAAGYDADKRQMSVKFNDGHTYVFSDVPNSVYDDLRSSDSAGGYFNSSVRGKYSHEKVSSVKTESKNPFDRISPPPSAKSLSEVLVDLRSLDTPEKWKAYVDRKSYSKGQKDASHHVGS
jgi:hypothetical protein